MSTEPRPFTNIESMRSYQVAPDYWWNAAPLLGHDQRRLIAERHAWRPLRSWGRQGWPLLEWPQYVAYTRDTAEGFELATDRESQISTWRFPTAALREFAVDLLAFLHWQHNAEPWVASFDATAIPNDLRGPERGTA